jgi:hypothetical protein
MVLPPADVGLKQRSNELSVHIVTHRAASWQVPAFKPSLLKTSH